MNMIIFILVFVVIFALQTLIIKLRFINRLDFKNKTKKYLSIILYITFLGTLIYPFTRYYPYVPNWIYFLFSLPIGIIFLTFIITLIYDISSYILRKSNFTKNRRSFLKKSLDVGVISATVATNLKAIDNVKNIELENIEIKIKDLKKPYRIVQLSDIHIGGLITKKFIQNLVKKVNTLKGDIIVITGDLVDIKLEYAKESLEELKKLKSTYGTYFIVGNHEYFHGISEIIEYVKSLDIKVLENENVYIGEENRGFNLVGVYDRIGFRYKIYEPNIYKALENLKDSPTILLAHQPKYVEEIKDTSKIDLILSGHTHGGQIFPFNFLVKLQQPYIKGLHQHNKTTQIYINKGTGYWGPPMRLGASSEITLLKIS